MKRVIALLLSAALLAGGLGSLAQAADTGNLSAFVSRFQWANIDPSINSVGASETLDGNYTWICHIGNNYSETVNGPTIHVESLLEPDLFPYIESFPFDDSTDSLGPGESWFVHDLDSTLPASFAPGYYSARSMEPLEIPPGGAVQTVTVKVKPIDERYSPDSFIRVEVRGNVVADSNTQPSAADATINTEGLPGIVWTMGQSQFNVEHTFSVQLQVENPSGVWLVHKPQVQISVGGNRVPTENTGTSITIEDTILEGTVTYSVTAPCQWYVFQGEPYVVEYMGMVEPLPSESNEVVVDFATLWSLHVPGDNFENSTVTGREWWNAHMQNIPDTTGGWVNELTVDANSQLLFNQFDPYPDVIEPPDYGWYFGDIPPEEAIYVSVDKQQPEIPVEYTPGFDVFREATPTEFYGPGPHTQTVSITVIPRETDYERTHLWVDIHAQETDLVNPVIQLPDLGPDIEVNRSDDGH